MSVGARVCWSRVLTSVALVFSGCAADPDSQDDAIEPVESMYNEAVNLVREESYSSAARLFERVERLYPYTTWGKRGQILAGYAYYESRAYDDAVQAISRYIDLHPSDERIDYALYLRGMAWFQQMMDIERDQAAARNAIESFEELIGRFPRSRYVADARAKVQIAQDLIAGHKMAIGRFYQQTGKILAAISRFSNVVQTGEETVHMAEALHRLVECYLALGLVEEANRNAAVLGYNFRDSIWYRESYRLITRGPRRTIGEIMAERLARTGSRAEGAPAEAEGAPAEAKAAPAEAKAAPAEAEAASEIVALVDEDGAEDAGESPDGSALR